MSNSEAPFDWFIFDVLLHNASAFIFDHVLVHTSGFIELRKRSLMQSICHLTLNALSWAGWSRGTTFSLFQKWGLARISLNLSLAITFTTKFTLRDGLLVSQ